MPGTKKPKASAKPIAAAPLQMQMIPGPLWRKNLRAVMGKKTHWRQVREAMLARCGMSCSICRKVVEQPRDLKCHEEWIYFEGIEPAVAWLWRVSMVCFHCHAAGHPGALNAIIAEGSVTERARKDTIAHFCKLNGVTKRHWSVQLRRSYSAFERLSRRSWYIDYGPFAEWMVSTYEQDPLNRQPWPAAMEQFWGGDHERPTIESIVASLPSAPADSRPASPHGFLALIVEEARTKERDARRRKALKRKREANRAAELAARPIAAHQA